MKKILVIGCGARAKWLLQYLKGLGEDILVSSFCDPRTEAAEAFCEEFDKNAKVKSDWHQALTENKPDWVFIFTPNHLHAEQAIAALEAGCHVYCEKPLATTVTDIERVKQAYANCEEGRHFVVGFTLRFSPHYRAIIDCVEKGELGQILSLEFNEHLHFDHGGYIHGDWRRLTELSGPHILEKCCHDLDIIRILCGGQLPLQTASFGANNFFTKANANLVAELGNNEEGRPAFSTWKRVEDKNPFLADKDIVDHQTAIMLFKNGINASFHTSCVSSLPERRLYICGSRGTLRADVIAGKIEIKKHGYDTEILDLSTDAKGGHGDGDPILADELREAILNDIPASTTIADASQSALMSLMIEEARLKGMLINRQQFLDHK